MPLETRVQIDDRARFFALYQSDIDRKNNNPKVIYAQYGSRKIRAHHGSGGELGIFVGPRKIHRIPRFYIVTGVERGSLYGQELRLVDGGCI